MRVWWHWCCTELGSSMLLRGEKKIWQGVSLERSGHPFSTKHDEFWSCFLVETALRAFLASREATSIF